MAGGRTLKLEILGDPKGGQKAFQGLEQSAGKAEGALGKLGRGLAGVAKIAAGFVVGTALTRLPGLLTGMAQAAADDAASMARLQQAVTNANGSFEQYAGAI